MTRSSLLFFPLAAIAAGGAVVAFQYSPAQAQSPSVATAQPTASSSCKDEDSDGFGLGCAAGADCNDQDPAIHPGQPESCNLRDDDCDGKVDNSPSCALPALDNSRVHVPAGAFMMGSTTGAQDERPLHRVRVSGFTMDRYEVTNQRYKSCVDTGKCQLPMSLASNRRKEYFGTEQYADYPVVFVDWNQASTFCKAEGGRLPTEAEWEMAARGPEPSARTFPWGDEAPDCTRANMGGAGSCVGDTDRVGIRLAGKSFFGAMDMAGNVWEWTADNYSSTYYQSSPATNPKGPASGNLKVMRGGCWVSGADSLRVSCRKAELAGTWAPNVGFRCVFPEGR
jgi:formylglycine-generating enzyme required for sulfatase activity